MDVWKFFDITHREHVVCNPTSEEKLARLVQLVRLPPEAGAVDIACGKGEFLIRLIESYGTRCTGIDLSSHFIAAARSRVAARVPDADVTLRQMDGADFRPGEPHRFSLASCLGASWIFGGHARTLEALAVMVEPGGWVIAGEPFWLREPPEGYLGEAGVTRETFGTHASNADAGERIGLTLVYTLVSSKDDWDHYEGLQWFSAAEYARTRPDDPDLPELLGRVAKGKAAYLRWGRETVGWAIYAFRRTGSSTANKNGK